MLNHGITINVPNWLTTLFTSGHFGNLTVTVLDGGSALDQLSLEGGIVLNEHVCI